MDSLSQMRRRVDTLKRKFAVELAVCKLRPLASEHCDRREELIAEDNPPPNPHPLFEKLKNLPGKDFLRRLPPRAEDRGLIPRRYASTPPLLEPAVPAPAGSRIWTNLGNPARGC